MLVRSLPAILVDYLHAMRSRAALLFYLLTIAATIQRSNSASYWKALDSIVSSLPTSAIGVSSLGRTAVSLQQHAPLVHRHVVPIPQQVNCVDCHPCQLVAVAGTVDDKVLVLMPHSALAPL